MKILSIKLYKHYWIYLFFSLILIIASIYALCRYGLNLGLDFTGGSLIELQIQHSTDPHYLLDENTLHHTLTPYYQFTSLQHLAPNQFIIRGPQIDQSAHDNLIVQLQNSLDNTQITVLRFETVGPTLGKELFSKTINAILIAALVLVVYLFYRFREIKYGVCALLGVIHDTFILIGLFSYLGHFLGVEIDTMFITALLTTISFSVHDTVVMYDRIRENSLKNPTANYHHLVTLSVNQTLIRSLNNSLTVIFMLTALFLFGGTSLRWFALALLVGTILGTYSSPFTSIPLLLLGYDFKNSRFKSFIFNHKSTPNTKTHQKTKTHPNTKTHHNTKKQIPQKPKKSNSNSHHSQSKSQSHLK